MQKQILKLERHLYAPELNTVHFTDGTEAHAPQCTTIAQAKEYLKRII